MIIGIGLDLIDTRRMVRMLECHGPSVLKKLMLPQEVTFYQKKNHFHSNVAKVFSVKEAVAKAMRTRPIWLEIELYHTENGAPLIRLSGSMRETLQKLSFPLSFSVPPSIHISITDDPPYAASVCIIESL